MPTVDDKSLLDTFSGRKAVADLRFTLRMLHPELRLDQIPDELLVLAAYRLQELRQGLS